MTKQGASVETPLEYNYVESSKLFLKNADKPSETSLQTKCPMQILDC